LDKSFLAIADHPSFCRFVTSVYASTVGTLNAAIHEGQQRGSIQEYLEVRNRPANGVNYAWCVLAALVGVTVEEINNAVFGSFEIVGGDGGEEKLSEVFDMEDIGSSLNNLESLYRPQNSFMGKELTATKKRNVIKMILEGGLGLTIQLAQFSHGARRGSHQVFPMKEWKALNERYGGLRDKLVEKKSRTCVVEVDEKY
jgi:hypothetical protein